MLSNEACFFIRPNGGDILTFYVQNEFANTLVMIEPGDGSINCFRRHAFTTPIGIANHDSHDGEAGACVDRLVFEIAQMPAIVCEKNSQDHDVGAPRLLFDVATQGRKSGRVPGGNDKPARILGLEPTQVFLGGVVRYQRSHEEPLRSNWQSRLVAGRIHALNTYLPAR